MPIPTPNTATCSSRPREGAVSLPVLGPDPKRRIKKSKAGPIRAAVLILVQAAIALHIGLWLASGRGPTVSPVEPSESMYTLETGAINAGFIFFGLAMLSTAIFGRWFCGWGCHIVALQDFCGWLMKKCGVKPRPFRSRLLIYAPLALALYMFVWPTLKREVVKPLAGERWAIIQPYIGEAGNRPGFRVELTRKDFWVTFPAWYIAVPFLAICGFAVVYFLGAKGFCSYGCPYGGFFAPLDKLSPVRIRVTDSCEQCGHCTAVCTSNVRVHEEVRDFGMVVDPGCMKCLDCVSVCPNDALYVGFGRVGAFAPERAGAKKRGRFKSRVFDLTWKQELAAAGLMLLFVLAFRQMAGEGALLMAMGLAALATYFCWKLWELVREPNVRAQNLQLKLKGTLRPAGIGFAAVALATVAVGVWNGLVNYNLYWAAVRDEQIHTTQEVVFAPGYLPSARDLALAESGLKHFRRAGPPSEGGFGIRRKNTDDYIRMAWFSAVAGRLDDAEKHMRSALRAEAAARGKASPGALGGLETIVTLRSGPGKLIDVYKDVLRELPELAEVRLTLAMAEGRQGQVEQAVDDAEAAVRARPKDPDLVLAAAQLLLQAGRADRAEAAIRGAIAAEPKNAALANAMGVLHAVQNRPDEAVAEFERAAGLDPRNPEPAEHLAEILGQLGRQKEAQEWANRGAEARSKLGHAQPDQRGPTRRE